MPIGDNIYPDFTNSKFDIRYHRLKALVSDVGIPSRDLDATNPLFHGFSDPPGGDFVESVTGLDTDNTDPYNPIVRIAVDGVTITGDGTPGNPLVATGGGGTMRFGYSGEDDTAGEPRYFDANVENFTIHSTTGDIFLSNDVNGDGSGTTCYVSVENGGTANLQAQDVSGDNFLSLVQASPFGATMSSTKTTDPGGVVTGFAFAVSAAEVSISTTGTSPNTILKIFDLPTSADTNVLLYNPITGQVTYGAGGGGGGGGTVTSVALSMPSAFTVTGSPVTTSGTLAVTATGTSGEYIDGTGALQTFPSIGISADNGLTENTTNNVQLGGTLSVNPTTIATGSNTLVVSTATGGINPFQVTSTTNTAIQANSTTGNAVNGQATGASAIAGSFTASGSSGWGVQGVANNNSTSIGVVGTSTNGTAAQFSKNPSSTNTVETIIKLFRTTSGTATAGIGGRMQFNLEVGSGASAESASIISTLTDVTNAAQIGDLQLWTTYTGTAGKRMVVTGAGNIELYNSAAVPGASITDGILLYSEDVSSSAELKVRDEAANITTLSPHNFSRIDGGPSEEMAWAYYSERNGKYITADITKALRRLEALTGEQFIFTGII